RRAYFDTVYRHSRTWRQTEYKPCDAIFKMERRIFQSGLPWPAAPDAVIFRKVSVSNRRLGACYRRAPLRASLGRWGEKAMVGKSDFSPEEWKILVESAMMAALAVTAADPSGLWGALKEGIASARTIIGAAHDLSSAEVVRAVAADYETAEG